MKQMWIVAYFSLLTISPVLWGAGAPSHDPGSTETSGRPAAASSQLTNDETDDLAKLLNGFWEKKDNYDYLKASKQIVQDRWSSSGAEALDKVKGSTTTIDDEGGIAKILATIIGTTNNATVKEMRPKVEVLVKAESAKENKSDRRLALLKRMKWALALIDGEPVKDSPAENFNKAFCEIDTGSDGKASCNAGALKDRLDKNKEIEGLVAQASAPNASAETKQKLALAVDPKALGHFLFTSAHNNDVNTRTLAGNLARGLSTKMADDTWQVQFTKGDGTAANLSTTPNWGDNVNTIKGTYKLPLWTLGAPSAVATPSAPATAAPAAAASTRSTEPPMAQINNFLTTSCSSCHGTMSLDRAGKLTGATKRESANGKTLRDAINSLANMGVGDVQALRTKLETWANTLNQ